MTVSVCMSLYNGESYIEQQLKSILDQTRQPDQVILCDDGSVDETQAIVQKFIIDHQLSEKWTYSRNQVNLGYPACFYHAMSLCIGDIVFLADQDDVWDIQKIEKMVKVFERYPKVWVVCCKFGLIDAGGQPLHTLMAPVRSKKSGKLKRVTIDEVFYKCEWPGMVTAYRREWYQKWCPDTSGIPHDFLICARAAEEKGFLQLDDILAWHRRHDNNAGGEEHRITRLMNRAHKLKEIEVYLSHLNRFCEEDILRTEHGKEALQHKLNIMQDRYDALGSRNVGTVIKNTWKHRKDTRFVTAVCDIGITINERIKL